MIIPIDDKTRMRSDKYCWMIEKKTGVDKRSGKDVYNDKTYHANPHNAIKSASQRDIRDISDLLSFEDAMIEVEKIVEKYVGILEAVK